MGFRRDLQQHLRTATAPDPMAVRAPMEHSPLSGGESLKQYEIIRKLGQGGMGTVFLARDTKLGRLVAIKLLLKYSGQEARRFLAEARITSFALLTLPV